MGMFIIYDMNRSTPLENLSQSSHEARTQRLGELIMLSRDLFQGRREVVILHGDEKYRLRITRQDKLILTK